MIEKNDDGDYSDCGDDKNNGLDDDNNKDVDDDDKEDVDDKDNEDADGEDNEDGEWVCRGHTRPIPEASQT